MAKYLLLHGDCLEKLKEAPDNYVSSVVTDPPYGLSFMGKDWDHGIPGKHFWEEILRVSKPGAHLLAFGGTRTFHRLACAIEDAGWEIRDCIMWVYGSGFPKSLDVSKAIDKAAGDERAAKVQAATVLYHAVKSLLLLAIPYGPRASHLIWELMPDQKTTVLQAAAQEFQPLLPPAAKVAGDMRAEECEVIA